MLIAARVLQGAGAALMNPATLSIIAATFPPRERGTAIGIWAESRRSRSRSAPSSAA